MKLYLFGGAEIDGTNAATLKKLINQAIAEIKPAQILHIPYARTVVPEGEENIWGEGWVRRDLKLDGIELLDASNPEELAKANRPTIFMNGGKQRDNLYDQIMDNPTIYRLVMNAEYLIGESAGSMVCGQFRRTYRSDEAVTAPGLGILKDTIIEAHYSQRKRQEPLRNEMQQCGAAFGIGIDSNTGIIIDTNTYPNDYQVVGDGIVDFIRRENWG